MSILRSEMTESGRAHCGDHFPTLLKVVAVVLVEICWLRRERWRDGHSSKRARYLTCQEVIGVDSPASRAIPVYKSRHPISKSSRGPPASLWIAAVKFSQGDRRIYTARLAKKIGHSAFKNTYSQRMYIARESPELCPPTDRTSEPRFQGGFARIKLELPPPRSLQSIMSKENLNEGERGEGTRSGRARGVGDGRWRGGQTSRRKKQSEGQESVMQLAGLWILGTRTSEQRRQARERKRWVCWPPAVGSTVLESGIRKRAKARGTGSGKRGGAGEMQTAAPVPLERSENDNET